MRGRGGIAGIEGLISAAWPGDLMLAEGGRKGIVGAGPVLAGAVACDSECGRGGFIAAGSGELELSAGAEGSRGGGLKGGGRTGVEDDIGGIGSRAIGGAIGLPADGGVGGVASFGKGVGEFSRGAIRGKFPPALP